VLQCVAVIQKSRQDCACTDVPICVCLLACMCADGMCVAICGYVL